MVFTSIRYPSTELKNRSINGINQKKDIVSILSQARSGLYQKAKVGRVASGGFIIF
jgi:hypothetical protein